MFNPAPCVRITLLILLTLLVAGCTPHPQADGDGNIPQEQVNINKDSGTVHHQTRFEQALQAAEQAAQTDDFITAEHWLNEADALLHAKAQPNPATGGHPQALLTERVSETTHTDPAIVLSQTRLRVKHLQSTRIARLRRQGVLLLKDYGGIAKANRQLQSLQHIAPANNFAVSDLRQRIEWATRYGAFGPGQMFVEPLQEGGYGPQMVVIAHGAFQLGAITTDPDALPNEFPSTKITFERGFALSVFEVSVGEFARFIHSTGYRPRAVRRGFSMVYDERSGNFVRRSRVDWQADYLGHPADSSLPVLHVSALDAKAYADWLSLQTGAVYRLPSEAEFEYALRAGSENVYPWPGVVPPEGTGNLTGSEDRSPGARTWTNAFPEYGDGYWGPAPVGRFAANAFDVHDLAGNVSEWVADCWHANYRRAPRDGSAWINPGCRNQVIRGGSWASAPAQTRASWRAPAPVNTTNARIGFRVVRVL